MQQECAAELHASDRPTVRLLTRDSWDIMNIIKIEDNFNKMSHLLSNVTQVLRFCSNLKKRVYPDHLTNSMAMREKRLRPYSLRVQRTFSQWEKHLRIFTDQDWVMRCHGRTANADTVLYFFKYQIVLPSGHHPTKLYVLGAHARLLHSGMKVSLDHTFGWSRAEPLSKILFESVCYVRSMRAKPIRFLHLLCCYSGCRKHLHSHILV